MLNIAKAPKKIKIVLISALAVIVITAIIVAAILIPPLIEHNKLIDDAKSKIIRHTYTLAVDYRDRLGVEIPLAWTQDLPLSDYLYENDASFDFAVADGRLYAPETCQAGAEAVITYRLGGVLACVIYAKAVAADGYASNREELAALNGATGTFIQSADIILDAQVSITDFRGSYYGNHHVISGLDIGENGGGLFKSARSAYLFGIALTNVRGEISASSGGSYGALADSARYCTVEYCSAEGGFAVVDAAGNCNVGGLVGYLLGVFRTIDEDPNVDVLNACTTNLQLTVACAGSVSVGGIAGKSDNVSIKYSTVRGKITVNVADAYSLEKLYVGGFVGNLYKEYNKVYQIHYLDFSHHLLSEASIIINLTGGGPPVNTVYAGGAFGKVANQSLDTVTCSGGIVINGGAPDLIIGGVAGMAENEMYEIYNVGSIDMTLRNAAVTGEIAIASVGQLYAGGLIGLAVKTGVEGTLATVTPAATVDRGGSKTEISDTIGHYQD